MSLRDPSPRHCTCKQNSSFFEEMLQRLRAIGNTASNLISPRFETKSSHTQDKDITAQSTGTVASNFLVTIIFTFSINLFPTLLILRTRKN